MNNYDRNNLDFLMTASKEELAKWWKTISHDDYQYSLELLNAYEKELIQIEDNLIEADLEAYNDYYPEANAVLKNIFR
ncbi:hypothetical protein UFOVP58_29 [uncultured Caudovirales phage]|uniref:Uncharacterized protein n=1 Tax=uncultured Caudovirales phage TaxID=2100421 RepID=A0A6J5KTY1_9CAUD|nr:hypothetical protein UFOVP58_29 [uncultured Caudovirales phage]